MEDFKSREDLYARGVEDERTKKRLIEISELGMTEVGEGQFGIEGVMSGLYIEMVWQYTDVQFKDYMNWVKELLKRRSGRSTRIVDESIQLLFKYKVCAVVDHYYDMHTDGSALNRELCNRVLRRLEVEHGITLNDTGKYAYVKMDRNRLELIFK